DDQRLNTLIRVLVIAFIWSYNIGIYLHENIKQITIKKHGRRAVSFFSYGLDKLSEVFLNNINNMIKKALCLFLSCT
ncbi:hypothetical protein AAG747_22390, partial [Rapidithrix thailandica]